MQQIYRRVPTPKGDFNKDWFSCKFMVLFALKDANKDRSSYRRCYVRKGVGPATSFKKRLWHRCFPKNFRNFLEQLRATASLKVMSNKKKWSLCYQQYKYINDKMRITESKWSKWFVSSFYPVRIKKDRMLILVYS